LPDISAAKISLSELPAGFEELSPDELGMNEASIGMEPEASFAFVNTRHLQMIFGVDFFVVKQIDRVNLDITLNQPEIGLKQMVSAIGTENVHDEKILTGLEDVGDVQVGMTMVADIEDIPMKVDMLVFRRGIVGAILVSMTMEGQDPNISLHDLGKLFDQHIQEALQ